MYKVYHFGQFSRLCNKPAEITVLPSTFFSGAREYFAVFWVFFGAFAHKDLAHRLVDCYIRYISAISEGPLRVTAELTEMIQYSQGFTYNNPMIQVMDFQRLFKKKTLKLQISPKNASIPLKVIIPICAQNS